MVDWFYIGYCTVMAMFAVAFAYAAAFGFRALRRLPRSLLLGFATAATVATLTAQKTNNVPPNMNQPQMQQGGGSFQTGFTRLTGFVGEGNLVNLVNPVQTTSGDIARGWRVESVATNAAVSYAMPTNATLVGNWHIHGAASSFGNNVVDFGVVRTSGTLVPTNWSFPIGTNDEAFSSFWYFVDGRIRPAPKDAVREICAVGVPMSAVPGQSRLWRLDGDDGSRILTWENFFIGGDTNAPVNAQIILRPNGDFITRSNEVETAYRRVNPDDWDDDGIPNDEDVNPTVCDGDFFGPANVLPEGANTNAYCTVSLVATGPDALVAFAGDKPGNYPDPRFVAKSGVTNEVVILIGKTYAISSDWPFAVVGVSDPDTEVWQMRGATHQTYVCRPVTISASAAFSCGRLRNAAARLAGVATLSRGTVRWTARAAVALWKGSIPTRVTGFLRRAAFAGATTMERARRGNRHPRPLPHPSRLLSRSRRSYSRMPTRTSQGSGSARTRRARGSTSSPMEARTEERSR